MKRVFIIIVVFFIQHLNAQTQDLKRANRFFDKTFYSEAIPLYESLIQDNYTVEVVKKLADCYYFTNDYANAQRQYNNLLTRFSNNLGEEYYFRYAQTLKVSGKYKEANDLMHDYFVSTNNSSALLVLKNDIVVLENVSAIGKRFEIKNLGINTVNSEFGAVKQEQNLVFSGVKKKTNLFDKMYKWNDEKYLDLMSVPLTNIHLGDSVFNSFSKEINTSMHESNAVFTKDGKTIYFTRNNFIKGRRGKNNEKVSNLQIFKAELVEGKWSNITSLPFNDENYSTEHPALSNDEKTLYFASDMPGTLGSFDIFSVSINGSVFGTPKNLGSKINTNKKEQFPYFSKDNKLYFSSNGHAGYGLLDVFVSEFEGDVFLEPSNVGLPLNSAYDDFSFNIDSDTKHGYFSSNRAGGKGGDDIYEFTETKPLLIEDCKQFIEGVVSDVDTKLPLENVLVVLFNSDNVEVVRSVTSGNGKFVFTVTCDAKFNLVATKEEFTKGMKSLQLNKDREKINDASVSLRSFVIIKKEEEVALQLKKEQELALQEKNKAKEIALVEKAKKDKVIAAKKAVEKAKIQEKEQINTIIETEKDVVKVDNQLVISTDPIYFDYSLWYIRRDAKPILDKVIDLMKKHPSIIVEIGSHTDNRGNAKYNLNLSSKRANSTRDYFIKNGIPENRILAKGYGESEQVIKCEPSESCTEEQHELNRRNIFTIKSL